jgi:predicted Zn-dependent protease
MSYCRFKADFNKEREYRPRLVERAVKQGISSTFFILDIPRCTTAMCVRAYPHSLEEQDLKKAELCSWCKEQLSMKLKELRKNK